MPSVTEGEGTPSDARVSTASATLRAFQGRSRYRQSTLQYRLRPLERTVDTVISLQDMPISYSNRCREPSRREVEGKEPWEALSNATVVLSVSCQSSDGTTARFHSEPRPTIDNRVGVRGLGALGNILLNQSVTEIYQLSVTHDEQTKSAVQAHELQR